MGTSVGTKVFVSYGWRPAAALSLGWSGAMLVFMLARGPHCPRYTWFGWKGGREMRKKRLQASLEDAQPALRKGPTDQLTSDKVDDPVENGVYSPS